MRRRHLATVTCAALIAASQSALAQGDANPITPWLQSQDVALAIDSGFVTAVGEGPQVVFEADVGVNDAPWLRLRFDEALLAPGAYLAVTSGTAQVRALEAAEVSSRSALEANRLGYEVGVRINIDVLNAQSQLADTQRQLARARYDTLLAQLRLKSAAGTLGEEDVQRINGLLAEDPTSLAPARLGTER